MTANTRRNHEQRPENGQHVDDREKPRQAHNEQEQDEVDKVDRAPPLPLKLFEHVPTLKHKQGRKIGQPLTRHINERIASQATAPTRLQTLRHLRLARKAVDSRLVRAYPLAIDNCTIRMKRMTKRTHTTERLFNHYALFTRRHCCFLNYKNPSALNN